MSEKYIVKIPTEIFSRVVGYYRPVQNWNKGKKQEFADRATYTTMGKERLFSKKRDVAEQNKTSLTTKVNACQMASYGQSILHMVNQLYHMQDSV